MQWDDDDFHHPERMAVQLRALLATNSDCALLRGWLVRNPLHALHKKGPHRGPGWIDSLYLLRRLEGHEGSIIAERRTLLGCYPDNITRSSDGRLGEDTLCLIKIGHDHKDASKRRCSIQDIPSWLYIYNLHGSQTITSTHREQILKHATFLGRSPVSPESMLDSNASIFWGRVRYRYEAYMFNKRNIAELSDPRGSRAPTVSPESMLDSNASTFLGRVRYWYEEYMFNKRNIRRARQSKREQGIDVTTRQRHRRMHTTGHSRH